MQVPAVQWRVLRGSFRLIFVCAFLILSSRADAAQALFPSDGEDPKLGGSLELLETVCPGRVTIGKEVRCRIVCPKFTGFPGEDYGWSLARVTRGHFLSATSEDAALSMEGCQPHSRNFGGTILLTRRAQRWSMIWYKPGVDTNLCHKIGLPNGREILLCMGEYGGQGLRITSLYLEDLRNPIATMIAADGKSEFFSVSDNTLTCGQNDEDVSNPEPLTRASIRRVEFNTHDANRPASISVTADFGERAMTPENVKRCEDELIRQHRVVSELLPATKRYRINFFFDGHDYKVAPASAAAARVFTDRRQ
jgi:hypothetical protein